MNLFSELAPPYTAAADEAEEAQFDQVCREVFAVIDFDGSGTLELDEFLTAVKLLGMDHLPTDNLKKQFEIYDTDGEGSIEFEQFKDMARNLMGPGDVSKRREVSFDRVRAILAKRERSYTELLDLAKYLMKYVSFYQQLTKEVVVEVCRFVRLEEVKAGEWVTLQGEEGNTHYVILGGSAAVFVKSPNEENSPRSGEKAADDGDANSPRNPRISFRDSRSPRKSFRAGSPRKSQSKLFLSSTAGSSESERGGGDYASSSRGPGVYGHCGESAHFLPHGRRRVATAFQPRLPSSGSAGYVKKEEYEDAQKLLKNPMLIAPVPPRARPAVGTAASPTRTDAAKAAVDDEVKEVNAGATPQSSSSKADTRGDDPHTPASATIARHSFARTLGGTTTPVTEKKRTAALASEMSRRSIRMSGDFGSDLMLAPRRSIRMSGDFGSDLMLATPTPRHSEINHMFDNNNNNGGDNNSGGFSGGDAQPAAVHAVDQLLVLSDGVPTWAGDLVGILNQGDSLGEGALLSAAGDSDASRRRTASVRVEADTQLLALDRAMFERTLGRVSKHLVFQPDFCRRILEKDPQTRTDAECSKLMFFTAAMPVFKDLEEPLRRKMARRMLHETHPAGSTVCREGDVADCMYIVVEGSCTVHMLDPEKASRAVRRRRWRRRLTVNQRLMTPLPRARC